jgi:hypothetical protein
VGQSESAPLGSNQLEGIFQAGVSVKLTDRSAGSNHAVLPEQPPARPCCGLATIGHGFRSMPD